MTLLEEEILFVESDFSYYYNVYIYIIVVGLLCHKILNSFIFLPHFIITTTKKVDFLKKISVYINFGVVVELNKLEFKTLFTFLISFFKTHKI